MEADNLFFDLISRLGKNVKPNKNQLIRSPFREDRKPSFSIFYYNNAWLYKDHATGECGNVITLVSKIMNISTKEAYKFLIEQKVIDTSVEVKKETSPQKESMPIKKYKIELCKEKEYSFYKYIVSIRKEILEANRVKEYEKVVINSVSYTASEYLIGYTFDKGLKLYRPQTSKQKKWFASFNIDKHYVFGLNSLNLFRESKEIYICAGEKDTLVLQECLSKPAICFQSETTLPNEDLMCIINSLGKIVVIVYDNDNTGEENRKKLEEHIRKHNVLVHHRYVPKKYKDIAEMYLEEKRIELLYL